MIDLPATPEDKLRLLSSLKRFSYLDEVREMRDWLKTELIRLDTKNRREADEVEFRQRQGACLVLEKLFELADTSDKLIEQIRANQNNRKELRP